MALRCLTAQTGTLLQSRLYAAMVSSSQTNSTLAVRLQGCEAEVGVSKCGILRSARVGPLQAPS